MSGHPFQELFCSSCDTTTPGANGFLLGGFNNDLGPQGVNSVILGGKNMNVNVNAAVVGAGQRNEVTADFGHALGSFAKVSDAGAIVISARNTAGNVRGTGLGEVQCTSTGENTITLCSREPNGVFINDLNVVDELHTVKQQATESAAALMAEQRRVANLAEQIAALNESLQNLDGSIIDECKAKSVVRRRLLEGPCTYYPTKMPTGSPTLAFLLTDVGAKLEKDKKAGGEKWTNEDYWKLEAEGIDEFNEACAMSQAQINAIFSQTSKQLKFRSLFPFCGPTLTPGEIAGIVAAAAAVAGLLGGICGNQKVQASCAKKCKACTRKREPEADPQIQENVQESEASSHLLVKKAGSSSTLAQA